MAHLPFTILAYLFNALSVLSSKFLLHKVIPDPLVYIFYISLISVLAIMALPFTQVPTTETFILASLSTILWTMGAYFMFKALKIGSVTRVIPIIGTLIPLVLLLFAAQESSITTLETLAVGLLTTGMVFLTITDWKTAKMDKKEVVFIITSSILFAVSYIVLRQAYLSFDFFSVLVWSRLILLPFGLLMLTIPNLRRKIITPKGISINFFSKNGLIFLGGQTSGALSEFLILFSISLANPALVNSLQGVQYIILFIFAIFLSKAYPAVFEEKNTFKSLALKILGIVLISMGLYLLAFS